jgi:hypothetical protein
MGNEIKKSRNEDKFNVKKETFPSINEYLELELLDEQTKRIDFHDIPDFRCVPNHDVVVAVVVAVVVVAVMVVVVVVVVAVVVVVNLELNDFVCIRVQNHVLQLLLVQQFVLLLVLYVLHDSCQLSFSSPFPLVLVLVLDFLLHVPRIDLSF